MTEQARPFKNINNKIDTLETPGVTRIRPTKTATVREEVTEVGDSDNQQERSTLDKLVATGWLNWESLIWLGLIALAIFMHLVDLGPRAMHHDESIHGRFSYDMFKGINVYKYDPTWHGPLLYYMVSLSFFLFGGVTETTARLAPAIYGIGLVAICYFLRPIIGKIGALSTGVYILLSPSILYYGRSLRHDIFATLGELLFVIGFFRFIQQKPGQKIWWLGISGLGLVITFASHEMVFLNTAILVMWLGLALVFELVALPARIKNQTKIKDEKSEPLPESDSPEVEIEPEKRENQADELAGQDLDKRREPVGDPILGNWGYVGVALFAVISLAVLVSSFYLFKASPIGVDATAFGLPQWLLTIPFGILMALLVAYSLGGFLAFGFSRLEAKNVKLGRIIILGSFVLLGIAGVFVGLRNKAPVANPATPAALANGAEVGGSDIYLLGMYVLPRAAFNLLLAAFAALFIGLLASWLGQRRFLVYTAKGRYAAAVSFFVVMLLASLVSLRFALGDKAQGIPKGGLFLVGPQIDKWQAYVFNGFFLALVVGLLAGWLVSLADCLDDSVLAGSATLRGILRIARQPLAVGAFLLGFGVIYILLFSNFFFNVAGLADGVYRGVEYWGEQHNKRRLDQPWFYYPFLMLLYEIVPVILSFMALFTFPVIFVRRAMVRGYCRFTVRGLFIGYTLWWTILATIVYSLAGEKAPWLNMQITLPATLAGAAFLDFYVRRIPWREFWGWRKGPLFAGLFVLSFAAVCVVIGLLINLSSDNTQKTSQLIEAVIVVVVGLGIFGACFWLWWTHRISGPIARTAIGLVIFVGLFGYTIKSTIALNYQHPDTAVEPLIYVQTAPELPLFVQRLDRLSRDLRDTYKTTPPPAGTTQPDPTNSKGLPVLFSNEVAWPLEWYLRDYTGKSYITPNTDTTATPALTSLVDGRGNNYVAIGVQTSENTAKLQQQLQGQYTPHQYRFRWWFPEDASGYGGLGKDITATDWGMIARSFTEQPFAGRLWRYLMYRELWSPLQSVDMVVYIRNDIDPNWGLNEGNNNPLPGDPGQTQSFGLFDSSQPGNRNGQYRTPRDLAIAPNGDILVLDSENARVQRFDKDGKFISKFGSSGREDGKFALAQYFSGPSGITVDEDGNIYVSDSWNFRIEKFDKDGKFLAKWGDGKDTGGTIEGNQQAPNYFYGPRQLAYDKTSKELYVADTGNRRIVVYDRDGKFLRQFGGRGSGPGQFDEPVGVALTEDGSKVYVSDLHNKRVQILDRNGQYLSEIKVNAWNDQQPLAEPYVKVDKNGNLYVSDPTNGKVYKYDTSGLLVNTYDSTKNIFLSNPVGLAIDSEGNLLIADAKRHAIVKAAP